MVIWHWLVHVSGSDYGVPYGRFVFYDFESGSGSDLGEFSIALGLLALVRKHNCHQRRCWRIGHHPLTDPVAGVSYQLCRRHHPDHPGRKPVTAGHVRAIALRRRSPGGYHGHGEESS